MNLLERFYLIGNRLVQRRRLGEQVRFDLPVISVGGITVGGSGKTPTVVLLARMLESENYCPIILTRGYGGAAERGYAVVGPASRYPDPAVVGDEPALLASELDASTVIVGRRRAANLRAFLSDREAASPEKIVVLLDDGFQHLQIARDLDIVLVDPVRLPEGRLLPVGRLREPVEALARADLLLLRSSGADRSPELHRGDRLAAAYSGDTMTIHERIGVPIMHRSGEELPVGSSVLLVTGVAGGARVRRSCEQQGIVVVEHLEYRDHHAYRPGDVARIIRTASSRRVTRIVTTGKDLVKLRRFTDLAGMLALLPHRIEVAEPERFRGLVLDRISPDRTVA